MTSLKEFPSGKTQLHTPGTEPPRAWGQRGGVSDRLGHPHEPTLWAPTRATCTHGGMGTLTVLARQLV